MDPPYQLHCLWKGCTKPYSYEDRELLFCTMHRCAESECNDPIFISMNRADPKNPDHCTYCEKHVPKKKWMKGNPLFDAGQKIHDDWFINKFNEQELCDFVRLKPEFINQIAQLENGGYCLFSHAASKNWEKAMEIMVHQLNPELYITELNCARMLKRPKAIEILTNILDID